MRCELTPFSAKLLSVLLNDQAAVSRAMKQAATMPDPPEGEVQQLLSSLGHGSDLDAGEMGDLPPEDVPTAQDLAGPGAPTEQERQAARFAREGYRLAYVRSGRQPLRFSRDVVTPEEHELALRMVRRAPGLSFNRAVAMLRR